MKSIYFILLISVLASCASLKSDKNVNGQINLTKENLTLLNGNYSRKPLNQSENWKGDLFWSFYTKGISGVDSLCVAKITVIDEKNLKVTLIENDKVLKSKILKGKLKNGYFEMNRRVFFIPAVFLNVFRTTKFRIGILDNKNLTTDFKEIAFGTGFFIIPFFNKDKEFDFEYKKVNDPK